MSVLTFRVLLDDAEIQSYRDIDILESDHYESLHHAIVKAFGLRGDQMSSFFQSDEEWNKGEEIPLMNMEDNAPSMRDYLIKDKAKAKGTRFFYIYNFLTLWIFYVEVMKVSDPEDGVEYPLTSEEYGPNINEDSRDEHTEMPEMEGEKVKTEKKASPLDDFDFDDFATEEFGGDAFDSGEFENIDDFDL